MTFAEREKKATIAAVGGRLRRSLGEDYDRSIRRLVGLQLYAMTAALPSMGWWKITGRIHLDDLATFWCSLPEPARSASAAPIQGRIGLTAAELGPSVENWSLEAPHVALHYVAGSLTQGVIWRDLEQRLRKAVETGGRARARLLSVYGKDTDAAKARRAKLAEPTACLAAIREIYPDAEGAELVEKISTTLNSLTRCGDTVMARDASLAEIGDLAHFDRRPPAQAWEDPLRCDPAAAVRLMRRVIDTGWARLAAEKAPEHYCAYLAQTGWASEQGPVPSYPAHIFSRDIGTEAGKDVVRVEIPADASLGDYASRLREAIEIVALVEVRTPTAVLLGILAG